MYHYHTLSNGIRLIFRPNDSPVVHSGVFINIGSRDEAPSDEGMAHFIEHSIFKGTTHRRAWHILNRIDGVGGEFNAFTTKEETCIYASSLAIHLERCLDLFADVLFHSTFPDKEIEHEKDVVIEEIDSYRDTPAELIYDDFEELSFAGHPLAHNILGSKKNVRRFSPERLRQFMQRNYTTDRMVISVVGRADFRRVVRLCEKYFAHYPSSPTTAQRDKAPEYQTFNTTVHRHTHQVHLMVGCPAVSIFDDRKVAFALLNNIIGGPAMNSRLNMNIREKYGFCYTVESQYSPFSDAGLFYIYAGVDHGTQDRFIELIQRQLQHFRDTKLSSSQLHAAQQQYIGQMAINNEIALNEMQAIGKSFLTFDHVDSLEEMSRDIQSVTASDLLMLAGDLFSPSAFSTLIFT